MEIPKKTRRPGRLIDVMNEGIEDNSDHIDDEVQVIGGDQHQRNRFKKTAKKVKSKEEEELDNTLRESGIDCTDMTKEEKMDIAQVVMASKREAEKHYQSFEGHVHTDSEEEEHTTKAFQQAVNPPMTSESSQSNDERDVVGHQAGPSLTEDQLEELYNRDTEEEVDNKGYDIADQSIDEPIEIYVPVTKTFDLSADSSQKILSSSQDRSDAFSEAVHPVSDDAMEEEPIPSHIQKATVKPGPSQRTKKNNQRHGNKKQHTIDKFSHVIITDDHDEEIKETVTTSKGPWLSARQNVINDTQESGRQDARKDFSQQQLNDLMSEEDSPIKCTKSKGKKPFKWTDSSSDEETQNYFSEGSKREIDSNKDKCENLTKHKPEAHEVDDQSMDLGVEPVPEDFYKFPSLQRHYRNVKKTTRVLASLFAPEKSCPTEYTKAVIQLFSLYHLRLTQIQKLSKKLIPWSNEPVKVGYHLEHTIDAKKRGYNYEAVEDGPGTTVVIVNDDIRETNQKPGPKSKILMFRTTKKDVPKEDPHKDVDEFLDTFIDKSKRPLRSARKNGDHQLNHGRVAEDFDPFSPSNVAIPNEQSAQGRKRKLFNESVRKYGSIAEEDDFQLTQAKPKRNVRIKQRSSTASNETDSSISNQTSRKPWQRQASNLSTGSTDSYKSEDIENLLEPPRPPSRPNENSLDGLSQSSDVLLDAQGQLYSTQFCAMKEKRAKTPKDEIGSFDLTSVEDNSVQYIAHSQVDDDAASSIKVNNSKGSTLKVKPLLSFTVPKLDQFSGQSKVFVTPMQSETKQEAPKSSVKAKIFGTIGDIFKLGHKDVDKVKIVDVEDGGVDVQPNTYDGDMETIQVNRDGPRKYKRKVGKKRGRETEDEEQPKVMKINMVPCPLCNRNFPQDFIENHAADCNGEPNDEEIRLNNSQDNLQEDRGPQCQAFPGIQRQNQRMKQSQDDTDFIVDDDEVEIKEEVPQKGIMSCYVCDKPFRQQQAYDAHVEKCLTEARMVQEQVDEVGMDSLYEPEPEGVPAPKRKTRSNRNRDGMSVQQVDGEELLLEPGERPSSYSTRRYPRTINTAEGQ